MPFPENEKEQDEIQALIAEDIIEEENNPDWQQYLILPWRK